MLPRYSIPIPEGRNMIIERNWTKARTKPSRSHIESCSSMSTCRVCGGEIYKLQRAQVSPPLWPCWLQLTLPPSWVGFTCCLWFSLANLFWFLTSQALWGLHWSFGSILTPSCMALSEAASRDSDSIIYFCLATQAFLWNLVEASMNPQLLDSACL